MHGDMDVRGWIIVNTIKSNVIEVLLKYNDTVTDCSWMCDVLLILSHNNTSRQTAL